MMRVPPSCRALKCIESGTTVRWTKQRIATGFHVFARCENGCHVKTQSGGIWAPKMWFTPAEMDAMPFSEVDPRQSCAVCAVRGPTEVHHFAPREWFGDEADLWPTADLCRDCHERWHERVGQLINHRRAESAKSNTADEAATVERKR